MADGTYRAPVPGELCGSWCRLSLQPTSAADRRTDPLVDAAVAQVDILVSDGDGDSIPLALLLPMDRWSTVTFLPPDAVAVRLHLFGDPVPRDLVMLACCRLTRPAAALHIARRQAPRLVASLLRGLWTDPHGLMGRLRAELGHRGAQQTPPPFALWSTLFDTWGAADLARLMQEPDRSAWPAIATLVLHADQPGPAVAASRDSALASSLSGSPVITVGPGATAALAEALAGITAEYVAVLQAGEILPAHALALLAHHAARLGRPAILYADEDRIGPDGRRCEPQFKPPPSRTLMLSGAPCTGVWLIRRGHLSRFSSGSQRWAETLRLDAWLRLQEEGGAASAHRVPFILTHRRPDTETAPPTALAELAAAHVERTGLPAGFGVGRPLRMSFAAPRSAQPRVSIVIPSACHAPHVLRYISAVLARTDYADFEVVVVVSGRLPLDASQERVLATLASDRRVRRVLVETDRFNFSVANNRAMASTESPLVCLLNDDVAPCDPGWLATMVGHLADPAVGVVGALLCYPDRTIQHAGIVLLPDGTGEHLQRFLPYPGPGHQGPAPLSQEVSAVTGACLLTRRELWDRLNGMDEAYASAFNDVDFCLRARACGYGVVLAADAQLIHAESISFGKHYGLDDKARNIADRRRLRNRFPGAFQADPYHNPNLSLRRGDCHSPAFPPRVTKPG